MKITLAITGASGSIYAKQLAMKLVNSSQVEHIYIVLTQTAEKVCEYELGRDALSQIFNHKKIVMLQNNDLFNSIASGSNCSDAMVVVPCSMGMVARIANGISNDLISRAADVMIKENKKLIVVPRETPLSLIHLENLVKLKQNGVVILPASPSFYSKPQSIEQVVDTVVERIAQHLQIDNNNYKWDNGVL